MTTPERPDRGHEAQSEARGVRRALREVVPILAVALIVGFIVFRIARPDPKPMLAPRYDGVPLRAWAQAALDSAAAEAGVSFSVRPAVRPLDASRLGMLAETDGYHAFLKRCSSCHNTPDPSMHGPEDWHAVVRRMGGWMEKAGVLPLAVAESTAIASFLEQAARIPD